MTCPTALISKARSFDSSSKLTDAFFLLDINHKGSTVSKDISTM